MKSMMWRSTFREINKSFGRFAAIFAIVALGVSMFAGLKVVRPGMIRTASDFWTSREFYDYRILSTIGYEKQDVAIMRKCEEVRAAEGSVSLDVLCTLDGGNEMVLKAHSLTEEINQVVLKSGRLPEKADECVVDSLVFTEDLIGKKLAVSDSNSEDDQDSFALEEYTVVGIVQSPLYTHFERGNTSLGNGRITGFVYLPLEGFAVDYYTEVYVKFQEDFALYSEEYDAYLEEKEEQWETLSKELAVSRYERIRTEAEAEIADAKKQLKEGEEELADARKELEEARVELEDGEKKLAEGKEELSDARKTLEEKEKELADARRIIGEEEQKLADGESQLEENRRLLQDEEDKLAAAKIELDENQAQLTGQSAALEEQENALIAGEAMLAQQERDLYEQEAALGFELTELRRQLAEAKRELAANLIALEQAKSTIAGYQAQLNQGYADLDWGNRQLEEGKAKLEEAAAELAEGKKQLASANEELSEGESMLSEGRQELAEGEEELAEAEKDLADGREQYEKGLADYEDGVKEFQEKSADAGKQIGDAEDALRELKVPDSYVLGRDTNVGYVCFESDSGIVDGIADIFPVFFFAVAALVCITTMNRMVEEQRTQIGVLKALGYSQGSIMCKYLFYSGTAAAMGGVFGFLTGTWFFPKVIWFAYNILYQMDSLQYVFDARLAVISFVVSMLCSMGATWMSCRKELSEVAAQLMRPKAPKAGQRVLLERVPFIWKRLKFLHKVSVRNVFRYKKRFLMMVIGISGCTALLVTGFGIRDSIVDVSHHQYERIQIFDLAVTCSDTQTRSELQEIDELIAGKAEGYLTVMETSVDLVTETVTKPIYLVAAEGGKDVSSYLGLFDKDGDILEIPRKGESLLSEKQARQFGIAVGDTITLRDENMRVMNLKVSGIMVNYIYGYVYISNETYEAFMGEVLPSRTLYLNVTPETDAHMLSAELMKLDHVTSVTVNQDMMERLDSMLASMDLIVLVIVLCAAGLAFIVLYNLTNINITERIREIATIKVLGFYKKETADYVFRENLILTAIGTAFGLILGKYFHGFVMKAIEVDMVSFDVHIKPFSYIYSILLTIAFAWFVNLVMNRKLDKISMTESLKSVD